MAVADVTTFHSPLRMVIAPGFADALSCGTWEQTTSRTVCAMMMGALFQHLARIKVGEKRSKVVRHWLRRRGHCHLPVCLSSYRPAEARSQVVSPFVLVLRRSQLSIHPGGRARLREALAAPCCLGAPPPVGCAWSSPPAVRSAAPASSCLPSAAISRPAAHAAEQTLTEPRAALIDSPPATARACA